MLFIKALLEAEWEIPGRENPEQGGRDPYRAVPIGSAPSAAFVKPRKINTNTCKYSAYCILKNQFQI